ncbi:MAG: hypothetical protein KAU90_03980 [Sulfurovaceae bacterium]|nr:hypothetical protein [Sulfurovaceae bacterium]
MINPEKLVELAQYFTIIHHIKGRIRIRVSSKIKEQQNNGVTLSDIENLPHQIEGIKKIKINKLVCSITIEYDHGIFKKELWDNLVEGRDLDEVTTIINKLYKEVV